MRGGAICTRDNLVELVQCITDKTHHLIVLRGLDCREVTLEDLVDHDGIRDPGGDQDCGLVHHTGEPQEDVDWATSVHLGKLAGLS